MYHNVSQYVSIFLFQYDECRCCCRCEDLSKEPEEKLLDTDFGTNTNVSFAYSVDFVFWMKLRYLWMRFFFQPFIYAIYLIEFRILCEENSEQFEDFDEISPEQYHPKADVYCVSVCNWRWFRPLTFGIAKIGFFLSYR